jgi:hypothetical protein
MKSFAIFTRHQRILKLPVTTINDSLLLDEEEQKENTTNKTAAEIKRRPLAIAYE